MTKRSAVCWFDASDNSRVCAVQSVSGGLLVCWPNPKRSSSNSKSTPSSLSVAQHQPNRAAIKETHPNKKRGKNYTNITHYTHAGFFFLYSILHLVVFLLDRFFTCLPHSANALPLSSTLLSVCGQREEETKPSPPTEAGGNH